MQVGRLSNGEWLSGASAIGLFGLMFLQWFGVKATNTSSLPFAIQSTEAGKNAWEALTYIPIVLVIAIIGTLLVTALRVTNAIRIDAGRVYAVLSALGGISGLLIVIRIFDPPVFAVERTITYEGTIQIPIVLALLTALGIAFGSFRAMREAGGSASALRDRSDDAAP